MRSVPLSLFLLAFQIPLGLLGNFPGNGYFVNQIELASIKNNYLRTLTSKVKVGFCVWCRTEKKYSTLSQRNPIYLFWKVFKYVLNWKLHCCPSFVTIGIRTMFPRNPWRISPELAHDFYDGNSWKCLEFTVSTAFGLFVNEDTEKGREERDDLFQTNLLSLQYKYFEALYTHGLPPPIEDKPEYWHFSMTLLLKIEVELAILEELTEFCWLSLWFFRQHKPWAGVLS